MPTAFEPGPQHVGTLWLLELSEPSLNGKWPKKRRRETDLNAGEASEERN